MKHPLIALLLASTSTIALHSQVEAQSQTRLHSAFKPSVEVYLEALDVLRGQPPAMPAPKPQTLNQPLSQPLTQPSESPPSPTKTIIRQPVSQARELPPSRYEERNRAIQADQPRRNYLIANNGLPRDAQGRIIPPALPGIKAPSDPARTEAKNSGWLADTSNYVGGLFGSEKAVDPVPSPTLSQAQPPAPVPPPVPLENKLPFKKPLPVLTENNSVAPNNALPSLQTTRITAPTPTESPKPILQKTEVITAPTPPPPSPSQPSNVASYDGLELAEGLQNTAGTPPMARDLSMPLSTMRAAASPTPPPAAIALPKPKLPAGEQLLGHVSDDTPMGKTLRDPFEDGAVRYAEATPPAAPQPTPTEVKKPIAAEAPTPVPTPSAPTPQPVTETKEAGWMDSLKNTVTGHFSDEETAPTPVPELNKNPDLKLEEMQTPPPAATSADAAPTALPSLPQTIKPDPTPAGLPSLTKLTGDPEIIKQTEERKVIAAPLPTAEEMRKTIQSQPATVQPIVEAPKAEAPKAPAKKAEKLKEKPAEKPKAAEVKQQAKITTPAAPAPTPEPKAEIKAEVKPVEPPATTEVVPPVLLKRDESTATASLNEPAVESSPITKKATASTSISFAAGESKVPANAAGSLNDIAASLKQSANSRVTIQAYASAAEGQDALARRVALARGLAVRAYLIEQGVSALRINVKSLGTKSSSGNPDRVDVMMSEGS